jgi:EF-hand domain pair
MYILMMSTSTIAECAATNSHIVSDNNDHRQHEPIPLSKRRQASAGAAAAATTTTTESAAKRTNTASVPTQRSLHHQKSDIEVIHSKAMQMGVSEEDFQEISELFRMVDVDNGGSIDPMELRHMLDTIRVKPTQAEFQMLFQEIDRSDNGEIEFEEFVTFSK